MIEIEARLHELRALGLHRRTRMVSGPQGPHVVLDGKPVLLLCSNNYLGLADHPERAPRPRPTPPPGGAWAPGRRGSSRAR